MKSVSVVSLIVLLAGLGHSSPAPAQGMPGPQGSYQGSCSNTQLFGNVLVATCRMSDGRVQRSTLVGVNKCLGDIGNSGGALQCSYADGTQARGTVEPVFGGAAAMPPPPPGYNAETMQHCQDMRREATDLHAQLNSSWGVMQNSRLVWQDRQVRSDVTRCPN